MDPSLLVEFYGASYKVDLSQEIDISIPVRFDGQQFQAFGAPSASAAPYSGDDFTVSVDEGAGCNCPMFNFSAHLHGTHTECVGHISAQPYIVQDIVGHPGLKPALLITVAPVVASGSGEKYTPSFNENDKIITRRMLERALQEYPNPALCGALIIRTAPNEASKKMQNYDETPPPFFSNEAMAYIAAEGFAHLLLDAPSVDRLEDDGKLSNHHIFWGVEQGSNDVPQPSSKSITEFIFVPDDVNDGVYMLDLNIGNIRSDAAPSRPVLYRMDPA